MICIKINFNTILSFESYLLPTVTLLDVLVHVQRGSLMVQTRFCIYRMKNFLLLISNGGQAIVHTNSELSSVKCKTTWTSIANVLVNRITNGSGVPEVMKASNAWWSHHMETFSTLLALCEGNSPVTSEFPSRRPVTQSFDVSFDLHLNKRLSKQWIDWWFVMQLCSSWRRCYGDY